MTPRFHLPLCLAALVSACAEPRAAPVPELTPAVLATRYAPVLIEGVPHVRRKPDFCGEACVEMALARLGKQVSQDAVFDLTGLDPSLGRGAVTRDLDVALRRLGFEVGKVWHPVDTTRAAEGLGARFAELHADLMKGIPSIVCTHDDEASTTTEHFRLVLGYDDRADEVIYHEPAVDGGGYRRMARSQFLRLWPLKNDAARWTVIRFRLDPGPMQAPGFTAPPRPAGRFTPAAFAQHVMELRERVPRGFTVVAAPPFVVTGDERPEAVRARAANTVTWAATMLKRDFFDADPREILDVWLFKDKTSYQEHTLELFARRPTTPYGFYSAENKALIMNIATGGGTLVHEIVHPFVEADFPEAPTWLNEGLGSLFEQAGEEDGHIVGYTNWRLPGLQRAIQKGVVPSFRTLTGTSPHEFYEQDPGTNYAQARYLCYYLQQHGLLRRYYRELRDGHAADPTGYRTLQRVLGEASMDAFEPRWEAWVARLTFP